MLFLNIFRLSDVWGVMAHTGRTRDYISGKIPTLNLACQSLTPLSTSIDSKGSKLDRNCQGRKRWCGSE